MQSSLLIRTVSAPDADGSKAPQIPCPGADRLSIGATCDTASQTLMARLIFLAAPSTVIGCSAQFTLRSSSASDFGSAFLGVPDDEFNNPPVHSGCDIAVLKVDSVSGGNWTLAVQAQFPAGVQKPL